MQGPKVCSHGYVPISGLCYFAGNFITQKKTECCSSEKTLYHTYHLT